jgi:hypothetical protein
MHAKHLVAAVGLMIAFGVVMHQDAAARTSSPSVCAWSERDWSDMTPAQQALWVRLGWNRARWDGDKPPASDAKDWSQLTADERSAASQLGYGPRNWDTACSSSRRRASSKSLSEEDRREATENAVGFAAGD